MKKILFIIFMATPFMATAQEGAQKIDIKDGVISVYDINGFFLATHPLDTASYSNFINAFNDSTDLVSINDSLPVKRLIKFYDNSQPAPYIDLNYSGMDSGDKSILDIFVQQIKDL